MLKNAALEFGQAFHALTTLERQCWGLLHAHQLAATPLDAPAIEDGLRRAANDAIAATRVACIKADMDNVLPELDRFAEAVGKNVNLRDWESCARHLRARLMDDLKSEFYFQVDQRDVPLYLADALFGPRVSRKFPKATEDVAEAGKCLSLQRPTACVFHLMRVMEIGVHTLGKKLKVGINVETETWYQIMEHVDRAIRQLPAQTEAEKTRKTKLGGASANLTAVRIAQRNEVMHPKQTYTREEAHDVFNATRAFMDQLAGLV